MAAVITYGGKIVVAPDGKALIPPQTGAANCKRFNVTIGAIPSANSEVTLVTGDSDVAQHYADDSATCFLEREEAEEGRGSIFCIAKNDTAGATISNYGMHIVSTGATYGYSSTTKPLKEQSTDGGKLTAYADGSITYFHLASNNNNKLYPGTYTVLFFW